MNQTHQMKPIAAGLASLGRNGDSMLVHMTPGEVAGLQSLAMAHGGSLTINPDTGLPEAFILAPLVGGLLSAAGMTPLMAGLTTGLLGWAITGDLGQGILSGFGGAGGASLGGALGKFGAAQNAVPTITNVGANLADDVATGVLGGTGSAVTTPSVMGAGTLQGLPQGYAGIGNSVMGGAPAASIAPSVGDLAGKVTSFGTSSGPFGDMLTGAGAALKDPMSFYNFAPTEALTAAGMAASPLLAGALTPPQYDFSTSSEDSSDYEGPYLPTERQVRFPTEEERKQTGTKEWQYFNPVQPYPGFYPAPYAAGGTVINGTDPTLAGPDGVTSGRDNTSNDNNFKYGLGNFTGQDPQQTSTTAPTVNVINQMPQQTQPPQMVQQPQQQLPYEYPRAYARGGLASFADGGSTAEVNYGITPVAGAGAANFQGSYSIPSTEFQAKLDAREKEIERLMNPYGTKTGSLFGGAAPYGTFLQQQQMQQQQNPYAGTVFGGILGGMFNRGLTRAQAEAKLGPAPVWNPASMYGTQATTSAPGPTSQYQGTGVTSLPTRVPKPALLGDYTAAIQEAIGLPKLAKGGYLHGPGDGMSDSIPATIEGKQPARLADGEFVVPADVVSHLGNGSTKAGAQRLYKMMDKVRMARTGTKKQGKQITPEKYMPA